MYINHITAYSTAFYRFLSFPPRAFRRRKSSCCSNRRNSFVMNNNSVQKNNVVLEKMTTFATGQQQCDYGERGSGKKSGY